MKKSIILLSAIILSLLFVPSISAKSNEASLNTLTDMIWKDCYDKKLDVNINQPIFDYKPSDPPHDSYQSYSSLMWPYTPSQLKIILKHIDEYYYRPFGGSSCENKTSESDIGIGWNGCGILTCGDYRLVKNGNAPYEWNGVVVDPSQNINASGQHNTVVVGDENQVAAGSNNSLVMSNNGGSVTQQVGNTGSVTQQTGNGSSVTQQNTSLTIALSFGAGTIFGIILTIFADYVKRKRSKAIVPEKPPI